MKRTLQVNENGENKRAKLSDKDILNDLNEEDKESDIEEIGLNIFFVNKLTKMSNKMNFENKCLRIVPFLVSAKSTVRESFFVNIWQLFFFFIT